MPLPEIKVLEVAGLISKEYLKDPAFRSFCEKLNQLDMGRNPNMMTDSLAHWSRVYEYPFGLYGVLKYAESRKLQKPRVLDAACGFSPVPFVLAAQGHEVIGIDLLDRHVTDWGGYILKTDRPGGSATFATGDMEKLVYPDGHFDVAYSISSLEHTPRPDVAVREMCRVVKPGGLVLLTCDVEPVGSIGIPYEKFEALLAELDRQTEYLYPARWCHPKEVMTFTTRPAAEAAPLWKKAYRSLKPSSDMAVHVTARVKK